MKHEQGVWQRRFWEHAIQDQRDYDTPLDYIRFNPVKHGNKLPIFAALGIPEVWRHDGARVAIFTLVDDDYLERAERVSFRRS
jgi:hypothetical protein